MKRKKECVKSFMIHWMSDTKATQFSVWALLLIQHEYMNYIYLLTLVRLVGTTFRKSEVSVKLKLTKEQWFDTFFLASANWLFLSVMSQTLKGLSVALKYSLPSASLVLFLFSWRINFNAEELHLSSMVEKYLKCDKNCSVIRISALRKNSLVHITSI